VTTPSPSTKIPELSGIKFNGHSSLVAYSKASRKLFRDLTFELEFAAGELYAVLCRQKGHPLLFGLDVRIRARRVCRRLDRMAQLSSAAAIESVAFYRQFRREFAMVINPETGRDKPRDFDFED
jgi:hypothetical protein